MNPKILIIDDETCIRQSLAAFLDDYDYQVTTAISGEDALDILQTDTFLAAIVDLRLPGMNGDTFIQQAHQTHPKMRFLIHTGSVNYRLSPELKAMGINSSDLMGKPQTEPDFLLLRLNDFLEEARDD